MDRLRAPSLTARGGRSVRWSACFRGRQLELVPQRRPSRRGTFPASLRSADEDPHRCGQLRGVQHQPLGRTSRGPGPQLRHILALPAGGSDAQSPHTEDEIYVITRGRATLWTRSGSAPVRPGDVAFVPAGEEHRFVDIVEDFAAVVVFGPAEYSRAEEGRTS